MPQLDIGRKLLSITEARPLSNLSPTHLGYLAREGIIEAVKVGKMWLLYEDSLTRYLSQPHKSGPKPKLQVKTQIEHQ